MTWVDKMSSEVKTIGVAISLIVMAFAGSTFTRVSISTTDNPASRARSSDSGVVV
jgi:hypothetical protein